MKTILSTCILLFAGFMKLAAQGSVTFNYVTWNTSNCNAFSNAPTINGSVHKSVIGQPIKNAGYGLLMKNKYVGNSLGTAFSIGYTLQFMHQYQIKITATGNIHAPYLYVYPTTGSTPLDNTCNGPQPTHPWGNYVLHPGDAEFEMVYDINMSTWYADQIIIATHPSLNSNPSNADQPVTIGKITITDVTTNPPNFSLTSNTPARNCGSELGVTYTVHNNNNTPGVDRYEFRCEPGKWMHNGVPVTNITVTTNSISLTPIGCAGPGKVYGVVRFVNTNTGIATNELTLSKLVPTYIITGPANLNNVAGNYNLTTNPITFPPPSTIFICNALPTWNVTPGNLVQLTIGSNTDVGLNPNKGGPVSANGTVLLTASMVMCEQTVTASKSVKIGNPDIISPDARKATQNEGDLKEEAHFKIQGIYPNPTQGLFTIELDAFDETEKVSVDVLSVTGQIVLTKAISSKTSELDLSGFAKGNYVVRISNGKNTIIEKVILE